MKYVWGAVIVAAAACAAEPVTSRDDGYVWAKFSPREKTQLANEERRRQNLTQDSSRVIECVDTAYGPESREYWRQQSIRDMVAFCDRTVGELLPNNTLERTGKDRGSK